MTYLLPFSMWMAMTAVMMAPVVYPWLRALNRVAAPTVGHAAAPASRAAAPSMFRRFAIPAAAPFAGGYMAAWVGFSAVAAAAQLSLAAIAVPVPTGARAPLFSAAALMLAGAYQFTPLKQACLSHCRSPAGFLLTRWRGGRGGKVRMGLEHGLHCVGCCWALMALALVVGMANPWWMAVMAAVMVAETALPFGDRIARPIGAALIAAGAAMAAWAAAGAP